MPGYDRTGPEGQGPRTGRRLGRCNPGTKKSDNPMIQEENPEDYEIRRGRGMGRGIGSGRKKSRKRKSDLNYPGKNWKGNSN